MGNLKKEDLEETIKLKAKKPDIAAIINDEIVIKESQQLRGVSSGSPIGTHDLIRNEFGESEKDISAEIQKMIDEFISKDMIALVKAVMSSDNKKRYIENEISVLKLKAKHLENDDNSVNIEKIDLETQIFSKEEELNIIKSEFVKLYREAMEKTLVSPEFGKVFRTVCGIEYDLRQYIERELEIARAKAEAIAIMFSYAGIYNNMMSLVDDKFEMSNIADGVIKCAENKLPLIKAFIK